MKKLKKFKNIKRMFFNYYYYEDKNGMACKQNLMKANFDENTLFNVISPSGKLIKPILSLRSGRRNQLMGIIIHLENEEKVQNS